MAFPFYPGGMIAAIAVLGGSLFLFRLFLLALDRGAAELRGSIGPGLVRGVRAWSEGPGSAAGAAAAGATSRREANDASSASPSAPAVLEELIAPLDVVVEPVRRRRR